MIVSSSRPEPPQNLNRSASTATSLGFGLSPQYIKSTSKGTRGMSLDVEDCLLPGETFSGGNFCRAYDKLGQVK